MVKGPGGLQSMGSQSWTQQSDCVYIHTQTDRHTHPHHTFFIHSSIWQLGCFHIVALVNSGTMKMGCICLFKLVFPFSLDKYPELEFLDHIIVIFLIF